MSLAEVMVAHAYLKSHPEEAAALLDAHSSLRVAELLEPLDGEVRVAVLRRMNADLAAQVVARLPPDEAAQVLCDLDAVRAGRLLALLEKEDRERLLSKLAKPRVQEIDEAMSYPLGTAGSLMDAGVVSFTLETPIKQVMSTLRALKRRVADVLVCDDDERLVGVAPLQELLGAEDETRVGTLIHRDPPVAQAMTSRDEVVDLLERHRLASLPVVDLDGRLLGTIRYEGLVRAAQQAATDDLQTMVGAGSEERALSSPWFTVKSRLPWLFINLGTAFAAAAVVGIFDATIAQVTALAVLLPVVAGQSGNTGAQALAVTSRGLALREVRTRHWLRVMQKEVLAAFANGTAMGIVTAGGVLLWSGNLALAGVIGASMVVSMLLAAMAGALIPMILTAVGRDPATASSIILTTVTDITGFFSFLGLATLMMKHLVV